MILSIIFIFVSDVLHEDRNPQFKIQISEKTENTENAEKEW